MGKEPTMELPIMLLKLMNGNNNNNFLAARRLNIPGAKEFYFGEGYWFKPYLCLPIKQFKEQ